eukprot:scaffold349702_cov46-Prasinocladus_malaysianus.AAC.1
MAGVAGAVGASTAARRATVHLSVRSLGLGAGEAAAGAAVAVVAGVAAAEARATPFRRATA